MYFFSYGRTFLSQKIATPTRGHNILDLCFVNSKEMIAETDVQETSMSGHKLVVNDTLYNLNTKIDHEQQKREGLQELKFYHSMIKWNENKNKLTNIN